MTANLEQLDTEERAGLDAAIDTIRHARELQQTRCRSPSSTATTIAASTADSRTDKLIAARQQAARVKHTTPCRPWSGSHDPSSHHLRRGRPRGRRVDMVARQQPGTQASGHRAMRHQSPSEHRSPDRPGTAAPQSLRTDLELARQEIAALRRTERNSANDARFLGAEIEQDPPIRARHPNRRTRNPPRKTPRREHHRTEANTELTELQRTTERRPRDREHPAPPTQREASRVTPDPS